jgi:hypothetical protein
VRELSLRVAQLEGELEAAKRAIAVFENFDAQVQDSLSAALRAANQIRERARVTAEALAQEARSQQPANATELEAMRVERDTLRRVIDDASSSIPSRAAAPVASISLSEMRSAATEALRGVFKDLVDEIRASAPAAPAAVAPPAATVTASVPSAAPPIYQAPPAQQPYSAPPRQPNMAPPRPAPPPSSWFTPAAAPPPPYAAPPSSYNATEPQPTVVRRQPQIEPSATVEDVDVARAAAPAPSVAPAQAPTPAPQPTPAPVLAEPARDQWVSAPSEPIGEVQVVLSPISSFPRLVELERRLQGMPVVRTVYARDFRNGVATLAIGLRHPMTVDEFATAVTRLDYPRLRIVSTSGYVLELRIDAEASSIA